MPGDPIGWRYTCAELRALPNTYPHAMVTYVGPRALVFHRNLKVAELTAVDAAGPNRTYESTVDIRAKLEQLDADSFSETDEDSPYESS